MGNTESSRMHDYRSHNIPMKLPMPETREIDERFDKVLASMNLPPDKVKVLTKYDNKKKWELICDQDKVEVKNPPSYYIQALLSFLDPNLRKKRFRKRVAQSTKTLRELEISLRTNHIGWVREFLNEENKGLDVLVNYLAFAQYAIIFDRESNSSLSSSPSKSFGSTGDLSVSTLSVRGPTSMTSSTLPRSGTLPNRRTLKNSRTVMDRDDVHVCITCLRAIMNYQYGFNLVMAHPQCINEIALSLNNRSFRTKSLVLELLAAVCLVRGGHDIILRAFDNFKAICTEPLRFTRLMFYFKTEAENIDFMVSCMQFINIVVHSVEDMNFRVHLQHEFTLLGLDAFLEDLRDTESDRLKVQIQAYLDNMFDVSTLLEDSEMKLTALERVENLEEQLLDLNEKFQEQEYENMTKIVQLEKQLSSNISELSTIKTSGLYISYNGNAQNGQPQSDDEDNDYDDVTDDIIHDVTEFCLPVSIWHDDSSIPYDVSPDDITHLPPEGWLDSGNDASSVTISMNSDVISNGFVSDGSFPCRRPNHDLDLNLPISNSFNPQTNNQLHSSGIVTSQSYLEERTNFGTRQSFLGIDDSFALDPEFSFLHGLSLPANLHIGNTSPSTSDDLGGLILTSPAMKHNSDDSTSIEPASGTTSNSDDVFATSSGSNNQSVTKYDVLPSIGADVAQTNHENMKNTKLTQLNQELQDRIAMKLNENNEQTDDWMDLSSPQQQWDQDHSILPPIGQTLRRNSTSDTCLKQKLTTDLPTIWEDHQGGTQVDVSAVVIHA